MNTPTQKTVIAVDIGGTQLRVARVDPDGGVRDAYVVPTAHPRMSEASLVARIIDSITQVLADNEDLGGIGLSVAGPLRTDGQGFHPPNLPLEKVDLIAPLRARFACPVVLLGDTKAAVYAEWRHRSAQSQQIDDLVYVTVSSGIGCGVITGGVLLRGHRGSAGEMGHMPITDVTMDGHARDWEDYASGNGMVTYWQEWVQRRGLTTSREIGSARDLYALRDEDVAVRGFLDHISMINARGVENIIFAYDPALVVFGGSVAEHNWNVFLEGITTHIRRDIIAPLPSFALTELGDMISVKGAGLSMWEQLGR